MRSSAVFSKIQMNWFAVFAGVFCLSIATSASAAEKNNFCYDDVARFCKDVEPGGGRINECIKKHTNELSPACKEGIENIKNENNPGFQIACREDATDFCNGTKFGSGKVVLCLKMHSEDISSECKEKLK